MRSCHSRPRSKASRRLLALAGSALAAVAVLAPAGLAGAAPSPSDPAGHTGGIVPVRGNAHTVSGASGSGNLAYHNGPVMHTNTVYVIYWVPNGYSVSTAYETTINQFFTDVAHDSGTTNNVYAIDTQYYDNSLGHILYSSSFGSTQAVVDTDPLPPSGCNDSYTSVCLSDAQIQNEILTVMGSHGWSASASNFFLMMTAKGIGSCTSTTSCAFSQYCAYHGNASGLYYANMPYTDTVPAACDSGQYPNGDRAADSEINIISHEHNEAITDKQLNAWYDRRGFEIGDKCAWNFGSASGTSGAEYNQTINGHHYFVQQEYSNRVSNCALHA